MSLDLEIIPGKRIIPTPARLLARWQQLLDPEQRVIVGPTPHLIHQHQPWPDTEPLQQGQRYQLVTTQPLTISLVVKPAEEPEDYVDYVADLGRNLAPTQQQLITAQWVESGLSFSLESYAGRAAYELGLFWSFGLAIALEVEGWLIVSDNQAFALPLGIYLPQQALV